MSGFLGDSSEEEDFERPRIFLFQARYLEIINFKYEEKLYYVEIDAKNNLETRGLEILQEATRIQGILKGNILYTYVKKLT